MTVRCARLLIAPFLLIPAAAWCAEPAGTIGVGQRIAPQGQGMLPPHVPQLVSKPPLYYPEVAKQAHAMGLVRVEVRIGKEGQVLAAQAVSGSFLLRRYAEDSIRKWTYKPAVSDGSPVEATTCVTLNFHLEQ